VSETRGHEHEIEIAAPRDAVWRALTDGEELTRWYAADAAVEPREGGSYDISWGEGLDASAVVEIWEPQRRLLIAGGPSTGADPILQDYTLETRGGKTVLRVVTSGIPDTPDWDGYYDGTKQGWPPFLVALRHYLERHPGEPRASRLLVEPIALAPDDAWSRLTGRSGYEAAGLGGELLLELPRRTLLTTVASLGDGLLELSVTPRDGNAQLFSILAAFGDDRPRVEDAAACWREHALALVSAS